MALDDDWQGSRRRAARAILEILAFDGPSVPGRSPMITVRSLCASRVETVLGTNLSERTALAGVFSTLYAKGCVRLDTNKTPDLQPVEMHAQGGFMPAALEHLRRHFASDRTTWVEITDPGLALLEAFQARDATTPTATPAARRPASLPFMQDTDLKRIAERDLGSLALGLRESDPKVSVVFAGFVIEAVLLDVILGAGPTGVAAGKNLWPTAAKAPPFNPEVDEWRFEFLIEVCGQRGLKILSKQATESAGRVRVVRNIAHPGNERKKLNDTRLEPADAKMAAALVEKILSDVDRYFRGKPGAPPLPEMVLSL